MAPELPLQRLPAAQHRVQPDLGLVQCGGHPCELLFEPGGQGRQAGRGGGAGGGSGGSHSGAAEVVQSTAAAVAQLLLQELELVVLAGGLRRRGA